MLTQVCATLIATSLQWLPSTALKLSRYGDGVAPEAFVPRVVVCDTLSNFDCGYIAGEAMRDAIDDVLKNDATISKLVDFVETDHGRSVLWSMHDTNRHQYPHLIEEIQGIAMGSRQPFKNILALNFFQELFQLMHQGPNGTFFGPKGSDKGCTDYHINRMSVSAWGHNEDFTESMKGKTFLLRARIGTAAAFTALTYPGCLPGWSWGINEHGLAVSINTLTPYTQVGLASGLVTRDALEARSLDDAIERITVAGQGSGVSANMGILRDPHRQVNVETSFDQSTLLNIRIGTTYGHANSYLHTVIDTPPEPSSARRVARIKAMTPGRSIDDIRAVLGDKEDPQYPIYNNRTLSTAVFDMLGASVQLWTANPKTSDPVWRTTWDDEFGTDIDRYGAPST